MGIDLSEKLKALEQEIDNEIAAKNHEQFVAETAKFDTASKTIEQLANEEIITKEVFPESDKWAITLAGGGGKGSYEIGVWKALIELGLWKRVVAVSGSSVGALNATLMSMDDYANAEKIWKEILVEQFLDINDSVITSGLVSLFDTGRSDGFCSRNGLIDILTNRVDISKLANSKIDAYACIANYTSAEADVFSEKPNAEYIRLCEVSSEDAKKVLLASSAMPYVYPPETIYGKVYRDGGLANNVPVEPLVGIGADKLIVVKLDPNSKVNTALYSQFKEVIEIVPSREIGSLIDGTLDFSKENVPFRILLGYYDTMRHFYFRTYEKNGLPIDPYEMKRREQADYEQILSEVSREKTLEGVNDTLNKLNSLIGKYGN